MLSINMMPLNSCIACQLILTVYQYENLDLVRKISTEISVQPHMTGDLSCSPEGQTHLALSFGGLCRACLTLLGRS